MLNLLFGECPEAIYNTSMYFDNQYLDCWMEDPFAAEVIAGIEKGKIRNDTEIAENYLLLKKLDAQNKS